MCDHKSGSLSDHVLTYFKRLHPASDMGDLLCLCPLWSPWDLALSFLGTVVEASWERSPKSTSSAAGFDFDRSGSQAKTFKEYSSHQLSLVFEAPRVDLLPFICTDWGLTVFSTAAMSNVVNEGSGRQVFAAGEILPEVTLKDGTKAHTGTVATALYNVALYNEGQRGQVTLHDMLSPYCQCSRGLKTSLLA